MPLVEPAPIPPAGLLDQDVAEAAHVPEALAPFLQWDGRARGGSCPVLFGSKAQTLELLKPLVRKSQVLDLLWFQAAEWHQDPQAVLDAIQARFPNRALVFRSSACNEDGQAESQAGAYTSCLDVDSSSLEALSAAVHRVLESYDGNGQNQVLVQPMLQDVELSGVIMTHDLDTGAPYYVLNYDDESGKTDSITGGTSVNKTVLVHRDFVPSYIESPRVTELLEMVREVEGLCGGHEPLDIEFAKTRDGGLYLLQARRITVKRQWNRRVSAYVSESLYNLDNFFEKRSQPMPGLAGARTILGIMPDWNPAEIIGTRPRPLAISLYRELVTDAAWREGRAAMGYRTLPSVSLMVLLAGVPFIDVRHSFNSFLPAGLHPRIEHALINAWLARLDQHPEYHDKVEFQIAQTVSDFCFVEDFRERYPNVLAPEEFALYRQRLLELTRRNVEIRPHGSLARAIAQTKELEHRQAAWPSPAERRQLSTLPTLIHECRELGTRPFVIIARHAFIAEALLRSAVRRGALTSQRLDQFRRSLNTITAHFTRDFDAALEGGAARERFLARYGHLRPGTYDLLSLRYDQRPDLFAAAKKSVRQGPTAPFQLTSVEESSLQGLLKEAGMPEVAPAQLLAYAQLAMAQREQAKFTFTRHLSEILELIATWGKTVGLDREDLSDLTLDDILSPLDQPLLDEAGPHFQDLVEERRRYRSASAGIRMGYLIRDVRDLYVVPVHRSAPNFVTSLQVDAATVVLDGRADGPIDLTGKIACIENADPGFDWIFTRGLAGLISKFGGANSHMTIRCAELALPAAIGVGEQLFERAVAAGHVELNCAAKLVRPTYV